MEWLNQKYIEESFQELSEYYHSEALILYEFHKITFMRKYHGHPLPEFKSISDETRESAQWYFEFTFSQTMAVERCSLKKGEQFFFDDPAIMAALTLFERFINGERQSPDLDHFTSFLFLSEDFEKLSILLKNFQIISEELANIFDDNLFYYLMLLQNEISGEGLALKTMWKDPDASVYLKPQGFHGGQATKEKTHKRIKGIMEQISKIHPDDSGILRIKKSDWNIITEKVNDGIPLSFPTDKKYRDAIEQELSKKYEKRIIIKLQKN